MCRISTENLPTQTSVRLVCGGPRKYHTPSPCGANDDAWRTGSHRKRLGLKEVAHNPLELLIGRAVWIPHIVTSTAFALTLSYRTGIYSVMHVETEIDTEIVRYFMSSSTID